QNNLHSPKVEGKSANLQKYQPKWRGNQPTCRNISQSRGEISQPAEISAKAEGKSANLQDISAKAERKSANLQDISAKAERKSANLQDISAKPNKTPTKSRVATQPGRAFFIITPKRISSRAYLLAYNI
ncbi:hypothetical protein P9858_04560, partial [Niallia circulans]|uniref:hypothetical protein n=1 Tax=Niallia circulans TaxID=1397 RepID=UPI002E1AD1FB|nr:hypothetical protein [Niallia circulans]